MTVKIVDFEPWHARAIELQPAQQPELALGGAAELTAQLGPAFTAIDGDGRILCIAGLAENHPQHATAWALFAAGKGAAMVAVARAIRRVLDAADYGRIDTLVRDGFTRAHRFARLLGFHDMVRLRRWGPDGEDWVLYERLGGEKQ